MTETGKGWPGLEEVGSRDQAILVMLRVFRNGEGKPGAESLVKMMRDYVDKLEKRDKCEYDLTLALSVQLERLGQALGWDMAQDLVVSLGLEKKRIEYSRLLGETEGVTSDYLADDETTEVAIRNLSELPLYADISYDDWEILSKIDLVNRELGRHLDGRPDLPIDISGVGLSV